MKRLIIRGALSALFLTIPCWCLATDPFQIRIVDHAGRGVADVRVIDAPGAVHYSNVVGLVWFNPSVVGRNVRISIDRPGYRFPGGGTTLRVRRGGYSELTILR